MNLGIFSVGCPVFEIESVVTFQTIRSPTVFERMAMRLCGRYKDEPTIAKMTLLEIFEEQLGVASSSELVGPSIDSLIHLGVINHLPSPNVMATRLSELSLTTEGIEFLERDRLPGRSKTATVRHFYLPLLRAVKASKLNHGYKSTIDLPSISGEALEPSDCSILVRDALGGEKHIWKSANTEIHSVESTVTDTLWESQKISIDADVSGALTVAASGSTEFQQWLAFANPELVWDEILDPILNASRESGDNERLDDTVLRHAHHLATITDRDVQGSLKSKSTKVALLVVRSIESVAGIKGVPIILLAKDLATARRIETDDGSLVFEVPYPPALVQGFSCLELNRNDLAPSVLLTGLASLSWGGQARSGCVAVRLNLEASGDVWEVLRSSLENSLSGSEDSRALAISALWEPIETPIGRWKIKADQLPVEEVISDASIFATVLEGLFVKDKAIWQRTWIDALSDAMAKAASAVNGPIEFEKLIELVTSARRLLPDEETGTLNNLMSNAKVVSTLDELGRLRQAVGSIARIPTHLIGAAIFEEWATRSLSDENLVMHGPHDFDEIFLDLRSAYQRLVRDIGLGSLDDAAKGMLDLKHLKASALDSALNWEKAYTTLDDQLKAIEIASFGRATELQRNVAAWNQLASRRLAPPTRTDNRLIVFDTSALMMAPELVTRKRSRELPVIPRRVLEELDGLKDSTDAAKAQAARAAIRSIEAAGSTIRYESEALDLLPPDWDQSSDNKILSVAMYLRLSEVLLVTADINFRNKARAENINAQTPDEYRGTGMKPAGNSIKKKGKK